MNLWFKIFKKNIDENTQQPKEYALDMNSVYTNNYNETLDSFNARISHTEEIEIEPYDECCVTFKDDNGIEKKVLYFCVDNFTQTQDTIGKDNEKYSYEITLFSQTKLLEGIICPNLSITPYKLETGISRHSIYYYLLQYLNLYGTKKRVYKGSQVYNKQGNVEITTSPQTPSYIEFLVDTYCNDDYKIFYQTAYCTNANVTVTRSGVVSYDGRYLTYGIYYVSGIEGNATFTIDLYIESMEKIWHFSQNVIDKFNTIEAPELQWNAPTLREVFNDLMMIGDCIPVLRNNEIDFIDLTHKNEPEISESAINYTQKSQSADNYVSEIKMNLQNVMQTQINGIRNTITTSEYLSFTTDNYLLTSENIILKTNYPILNIKKFYLYCYVAKKQSGNADTRLVIADITNFIKEQREYQTMPILYRLGDLPSGANKYDYANYCVFYSRGSNTINGFTNSSKTVLWAQANTWELLRTMVINNAHIDSTTEVKADVYDTTVLSQHLSMFFKIEYETMTDQVFTASKDGINNKRTIVDNQTNSWVDAYSQGFLEYQKANRLGNMVVLYNQRISNYTINQNGEINNAIKIGDYKGDYVVYQTQYQFFKDHVEINAYATKNYILKNYWTGVNSKIRTWVNAQDEALIRHELEKFYCVLSYRQHKEILTEHYNIAKKLAYSIYREPNETIKPLIYSAIVTKLDGVHYQPSDTDYEYQCECVSRIMGNSYVFTTGFETNYEIGKKNNTTLEEADIQSTYVTAQSAGQTLIYTAKPPYVKASGTEYDGSRVKGLRLQPTKYVNDYGEFQTLTIKLFSQDTNDPSATDYLTSNGQKKFFIDMYKKPLIKTEDIDLIGFDYNKRYYKDNKEIFKLSIQFEFSSEYQEDKMYITKNFLSYNPIIRDTSAPTLKFSLDNYKKGKETLESPTTITNARLEYDSANSTNTSAKFILYFNDPYPTKNGVFISDENNNIIIGFDKSKSVWIEENGNSIRKLEFYLNLLRDKDTTIYYSNGTIKGEI